MGSCTNQINRIEFNQVQVFEEKGKPEYQGNLSEQRREENQQTQPIYDTEAGNRAQATLVGDKCSYHYTTSAFIGQRSVMELIADS